MRVAEDLVKDGMTAKGEFLTLLADLIAEHEITKVIETGTYYGTGTTMAIIDGLTRHGKDFEFHSIEVNPMHYAVAKTNVPKLKGVNLINGLSIPRDMIYEDIDYSLFPEDIIVDHKKDRERLYRLEVAHRVQEDVLGSLRGFEPELIVLDSAGHIGFLEYQYVIDNYENGFYLALDDTNHIKHFLSKKDAEEHYEKIFETDDKFGAACFKVPKE